MTVKIFFELAQLQTTVSTILTVMFGIVYAWYNYQIFNPVLSIFAIFLVFLFLVAVNVRDNYVDYLVASQKGSPAAEDMIIGREKLKLKDVRLVYSVLGGLSAFIILFLTIQTTIYLLYAAMIAFFIGVLYAAGPLPISSTPTGELFTGIAMGFGVFFAGFYVNTFEVVDFNSATFLQLLIASTPTTIGAINIVFANNICDIEEDVEDHRFTLPYYIGLQKSLMLYRALYYLAYLSIVLSVMIGILPKMTLLSFVSIPFIQRNIQVFMEDQEKEQGLRLAVINAVILAIVILLPFFLSLEKFRLIFASSFKI